MAIHRDILVFNNGQFVGEGDELGLNIVDWRSGQTAFIPRQDNHVCIVASPCYYIFERFTRWDHVLM